MAKKSLTRDEEHKKKPASKRKRAIRAKYFKTQNLTKSEREKQERAYMYDEYPVGDVIEDFSNEDCEVEFVECNFSEETYKALLEAIKQLTEKQRIIVEGFLAGKTNQQIADERGLSSVSGISLAWHGIGRGGILKKLRLLLEEALKDRGIQQ